MTKTIRIEKDLLVTTKRLSIVLPEDKHRAIKALSADLGVSIKQFVDNAIAVYISKLKKEE